MTLRLCKELVIFDSGDFTYHYGEGDWGPDKLRAYIYVSQQDALHGLDDVDCEHILRDRLVILPLEEEPRIAQDRHEKT